MGEGGSVLSTLTQTVVSSTASASATVIRYRIQTASIASQGGVAPIKTSLTVPYEILANGMLGVAPGSYPLGSGLQVGLDGFEMYPTIADLQSVRAVTSFVSGSLTGTTAATRQEAAQLTSDGQPLRLRFEFSVSGMPAGASIRTPAGTFRDLVAVNVKMTSMKALNANAQTNAALAAGSGLAQAFSARLYFAKGTGLVQGESGGVTQQLAGCSG